MSRAGGRVRPPAVVLGWAGVLALTVAIGVVGQTGVAPAVRPPDVPAASVAVSAPTPGPTLAAKRAPTRPPARPTRTRPPIGEDGVMGGLVFGTAFEWLEPSRSDRRAIE